MHGEIDLKRTFNALSGKVIFLHYVKGSKPNNQISKVIRRLHGELSEFFDSRVHMVVTNRHDLPTRSENVASPMSSDVRSSPAGFSSSAQSPASQTLSVSQLSPMNSPFASQVSPFASPSPASLTRKGSNQSSVASSTLSRGQRMTLLARNCNSSDDIVEKALRRNLLVMTFKDFWKWFHSLPNEIQIFAEEIAPSIVSEDKKLDQKVGVRSLRLPCFKILDIKNQERPIFVETTNFEPKLWPAEDFNVEVADAPATTAKKTASVKKAKDGRKIATATQKRWKKKLARIVEKQKKPARVNVCEGCHATYRKIDLHLVTEGHQEYAERASEHLKVVDDLIKKLPTFEQVIKCAERRLGEIERQNRSGNSLDETDGELSLRRISSGNTSRLERSDSAVAVGDGGSTSAVRRRSSRGRAVPSGRRLSCDLSKSKSELMNWSSPMPGESGDGGAKPSREQPPPSAAGREDGKETQRCPDISDVDKKSKIHKSMPEEAEKSGRDTDTKDERQRIDCSLSPHQTSAAKISADARTEDDKENANPRDVAKNEEDSCRTSVTSRPTPPSVAELSGVEGNLSELPGTAAAGSVDQSHCAPADVAPHAETSPSVSRRWAEVFAFVSETEHVPGSADCGLNNSDSVSSKKGGVKNKKRKAKRTREAMNTSGCDERPLSNSPEATNNSVSQSDRSERAVLNPFVTSTPRTSLAPADDANLPAALMKENGDESDGAVLVGGALATEATQPPTTDSRRSSKVGDGSSLQFSPLSAASSAQNRLSTEVSSIVQRLSTAADRSPELVIMPTPEKPSSKPPGFTLGLNLVQESPPAPPAVSGQGPAMPPSLLQPTTPASPATSCQGPAMPPNMLQSTGQIPMTGGPFLLGSPFKGDRRRSIRGRIYSTPSPKRRTSARLLGRGGRGGDGTSGLEPERRRETSPELECRFIPCPGCGAFHLKPLPESTATDASQEPQPPDSPTFSRVPGIVRSERIPLRGRFFSPRRGQSSPIIYNSIVRRGSPRPLHLSSDVDPAPNVDPCDSESQDDDDEPASEMESITRREGLSVVNTEDEVAQRSETYPSSKPCLRKRTPSCDAADGGGEGRTSKRKSAISAMRELAETGHTSPREVRRKGRRQALELRPGSPRICLFDCVTGQLEEPASSQDNELSSEVSGEPSSKGVTETERHQILSLREGAYHSKVVVKKLQLEREEEKRSTRRSVRKSLRSSSRDSDRENEEEASVEELSSHRSPVVSLERLRRRRLSPEGGTESDEDGMVVEESPVLVEPKRRILRTIPRSFQHGNSPARVYYHSMVAGRKPTKRSIGSSQRHRKGHK